MAQAMSNIAGRRVNVLFLCGGTGLGKTHLSNAIGHRILEQKPGAHIVYMSAESFMTEYVAAIGQKRMDEFRARYRNECDGLLIDDVQFLAGKVGTQEEFFHTFNALYQKDIPIVLTSDVLPQNLQGMAERLLSRFASGLVAEVYSPGAGDAHRDPAEEGRAGRGEARRRDRGADRERREQCARARGHADEAVDPGEPERPRGDRRGCRWRRFRRSARASTRRTTPR